MNNAGFYTLGDHLGSTSITVDESGAVVAELRYKAWGETRYATGDTPTTWRYTGQRQEEGLGLYYYRARWYDPILGRFAQADTIVPESGNPQGLDRYAYVANNPLKHIDPSGHCWGPFSWMRNLPTYDTTCNNMDNAWIIITHPKESIEQHDGTRAYILAVAYSVGEVVAHGTLVRYVPEILHGGDSPVDDIPLDEDLTWYLDEKVEAQMTDRGWTSEAIDDVINNPVGTKATRDERFDPITHQKVDQGPATMYYRSDGYYVVRNDETGEIIQVTDTTDDGWIDPTTNLPVQDWNDLYW